MPWLRFKRVSVSSGGVKQMTSSTRPLNIPCRVVDGTARNAGATGESSSSVVRLLYKKEDVRKDAIVMNCLRVMERILGESVEGLNCKWDYIQYIATHIYT